MSSAAKSIYYFSFYLIAVSIALIAVPNLLLSLFMLPETSEVWIKVVGMLAFNIGIMYLYMAREENKMFFTLTCYLRAMVMVWFIAFVALQWASPMLLLFGVIDLIGAIWTYTQLKKS